MLLSPHLGELGDNYYPINTFNLRGKIQMSGGRMYLNTMIGVGYKYNLGLLVKRGKKKNMPSYLLV